MLKVTPIAATNVCFHLAINKENEILAINLYFNWLVLSIHHFP